MYMKKKNKKNLSTKKKVLLSLGILIVSLILTIILRIQFSTLHCTPFNYPESDCFRQNVNLILSGIVSFGSPFIITFIIFKNKNDKLFLRIIKFICCFIALYFVFGLLFGLIGSTLAKSFYLEEGIYYKPILYLYPEHDIGVEVKIDNPEVLLTTYPKYNNGWNVHVLKDGSIYDESNKYYYALYWDEKNINKVDFSEGFYVEGNDAIEFLEDKLSIIGLNDRERNEFIMYWLPKLEDNKRSLVYFELTEERELNNKLIINPKPDSLLRINMHIKKVNKKINIKEQRLEKFDRYGFVAVEWGGTVRK